MEAFLDLINDIWDFLKVRKKYWLAPLILTLVLMGVIIVFAQGWGDGNWPPIPRITSKAFSLVQKCDDVCSPVLRDVTNEGAGFC